MNAMHESLKAFLVKKNFLSAADGSLEGFPLVVESAYRSFAEHKLGERPPVVVPTCLEQVNPRLLDDEEWVWLGDAVEEQEESSVDEDPPEDEIIVEDLPGGDENKETLPVAEPVSTPSVETGDLVSQEVLGGPAEGMLQDEGVGAMNEVPKDVVEDSQAAALAASMAADDEAQEDELANGNADAEEDETPSDEDVDKE